MRLVRLNAQHRDVIAVCFATYACRVLMARCIIRDGINRALIKAWGHTEITEDADFKTRQVRDVNDLMNFTQYKRRMRSEGSKYSESRLKEKFKALLDDQSTDN